MNYMQAVEKRLMCWEFKLQYIMRIFFLRRAHEPQNHSVEEVSWKFWLFTHPYLYCLKIFYISAENNSVSLDKARKSHYYSVEKGSGF